MKHYQIKLIAAALLSVAIAGCSTTTPVTKTNPVAVPARGLKVITKNLQNLSPMPHTTTSGAGCYELFSSLRDNIKPNCSVLFIRVKPNEELIKHAIKNDLIVYVIAGGGNMTVANHTYIISPGEAIYVPAGKSRHVLNNSKKMLEFLMYISPASQKADITLLQAQKPEPPNKAKIIARQNQAIAEKVLGKDAHNIGQETIKNVQELTPKENPKTSIPPNAKQ